MLDADPVQRRHHPAAAVVLLPDHRRRTIWTTSSSRIKNNALLAKYSGGLGNDWTPVRGIGAHIKGTNGLSSGVVPFLKIANDTAVAVNQGGKRKGAVCAYLETWHVDIEEFLDLRKNTGDDRRRTHDMNTANWVPDEFLRRVEADGPVDAVLPGRGAGPARPATATTSPSDTPSTRPPPTAVRSGCSGGSGRVELWRRMLTSLFETGHPWITFKDPCNLRSPQQHVGVVHSSNLCTEITLNTRSGAEAETAVCNLGSVNLPAHVTPRRPRCRAAAPDGHARRCGCSTTSSTSTCTRSRRPAGRTSRTARSGWG